MLSCAHPLPTLAKAPRPDAARRRRHGAAGSVLAWLALTLASLASRAPAAPTLFEQANPTDEAQYLLQKLNRARIDPASEGQRLADWLRNTADGQSVVAQYGTNPDQVQADFAALPAVSPLTFDASLGAAAQAHVNDLAAHNGLGPGAATLADNEKLGPDGYTPIAHLGYDGSTPTSRAQAAGYTHGGVAENVAIDFDSLDLIHAGYLVDWGNPGLGHRQNSMGGGGGQGVVGIGLVDASANALQIETEDFGSETGELVFNGSTLTFPDLPAMLTGVVYHDSNGNGQYDVGEGVQGATVTMDNGRFYAVTSASGGYALPLVSADGVNADGNVTVHVRFADASTTSKTVAVTRLTPQGANSSLGSYRSNVEWEVTTGANALPAFFAGAASLDAGWSYLAFANGNFFGYYQASQFPFIYHDDLGWLDVVDANDGKGGVFLYDFTSRSWFYTSPSFGFPYLYDFSRNAVLYYYPDTSNPSHYTSAPRYFYDFSAGKIVTL